MEKQLKTPIQYTILKCEEVQLKMSNVPNKLERKNLRVSISMRIGDEKIKQGVVVIYLKFDYNYEGRIIFSYEAGFHFKLSKVTKEVSKDDMEKVLPTLFSVSHSTLRGMVAVRALGTPLEDYPVPLIDLDKIFKKKE